MSRRIRLGMVGGGIGGFFGAAHRVASRIDDRFEIVAGALSSSPDRARESAALLGIAPDRSYADFERMATAEAARADGIEAVGIVIPNHLHFRAAKAFLEAGIHVICDKPLTTTVKDAEALQRLVAETGLEFAVTYTNAGFGMIREARRIVTSGEIGAIRIVQVEFPQEWLATDFEATGNKQAAWRTDPAQSGPAGSLGDIGSHAFHLVEFVTGHRVESVAAEVSTFVPGRRVDDDVEVLLRLSGGARGVLWASQVAIGNTNGLSLRVFGDKGSIAWSVKDPNSLRVARLDRPASVLERASAGTVFPGRMPSGHPEGFLEALGQLYLDFADRIVARDAGESSIAAAPDLPGIGDGVRGVHFIEAVLASGRANARWVDLPPAP